MPESLRNDLLEILSNAENISSEENHAKRMEYLTSLRKVVKNIAAKHHVKFEGDTSESCDS